MTTTPPRLLRLTDVVRSPLVDQAGEPIAGLKIWSSAWAVTCIHQSSGYRCASVGASSSSRSARLPT
jgi:hypothetical protein